MSTIFRRIAGIKVAVTLRTHEVYTPKNTLTMSKIVNNLTVFTVYCPEKPVMMLCRKLFAIFARHCLKNVVGKL